MQLVDSNKPRSMAYIGQNFNSGDLKTYLKKYRPKAAGYKIPVTNTDGALNNPLKPVSKMVCPPKSL